MKTSLLILGIICCVIAGLATPASIIYAVYLWGSEGWPLAASAWEACKLWVMSILCLIPGAIFVSAGQ